MAYSSAWSTCCPYQRRQYGGALAWFLQLVGGTGFIRFETPGKGRVFLSSYGTLNQLSCPQSFVVEHSHLLAFQPKLKLKVNFPRGIIGDLHSGRGLSSRLQGTGNIYWQSRSLSSLGRFIRLRLR
ncbi:TIGR00266 family protein [Synechocystis salina]|uniref:TIGR00266 family protein n=1 Tax=Synechocystis salina TaxID=945780 RepID=UPI00223F98D3|nr:TIGR00266 family protein [Synechocystis salina]